MELTWFRCPLFCQYGLLWNLSQNSQLSRFFSMWLGTSTMLHSASSPPFKHVLFCWKLLIPLAISPMFSSRLQSPCFTFQLYLWFLFLLIGFFCSHIIAFRKSLLGTCLGCSWTLHPLMSLRHSSPRSSICTFRNQSAPITHYIYRGSELQFWKKNCGGVQISKGVSFCCINLDWEHWSDLLFTEMNAPTSQ